MSKIHEYDLVALTDTQAATHKTSLETIQLQRGQIGTVVMLLAPEACLVDFADGQGNTYATETIPTAQLLLKSVGPEQFVASVAELHDCQVTAPTKEAAIAQLQKMLQAHLAGTEILSFPIVQREVVAERENPWTEFIGMYEGDADFAEIMAELRSERGLEPHSSI
jgi:predicted RNase H-like HicB family nuclease